MAQVFDYGPGGAGCPPYLVMEFVDGPSLADILAAGPVTPAVALDLVATAASGMAVRFAQLIAARPADRDQIMGHLIRLYLQTLGVDPGPGGTRQTSSAQRTSSERTRETS